MKNIAKILTALAAVAGVIYIIATYGEQIVAWAKKVLNAFPKCPCCEETETVEEFVEEAAEAEAAEEVVAEEVPVEEAAPEVVVAENEPVAAEEDFAE
jgi:xanthosine utilization system XapX-like protein